MAKQIALHRIAFQSYKIKDLFLKLISWNTTDIICRKCTVPGVTFFFLNKIDQPLTADSTV